MARGELIRLVGGPRPLDGTVIDVSVSSHDAADATDDRFVRAVRGTTVTSVAALHREAVDRLAAEQLAAQWRVAVYRAPARARRVRASLYRFEGLHALDPRRDGHGRWTLAVGSRWQGPLVAAESAHATVWTALEAGVDEAAERFAGVVRLLPDGPLAERALGATAAVSSCVADAARLCAVGAAIAPAWTGSYPAAAPAQLGPSAAGAGLVGPVGAAVPGDYEQDPAAQLAGLATRVAGLAATIDEATAQVVALHLEIGEARHPVEPVTGLADAWGELDG